MPELGGPDTPLGGRRLLILFPHMVFPGGALNYTLRLAEYLISRGATVGIVTLRWDPVAISVPSGVEIISAEGPLTSSLVYWCAFLLWQKKIQRLIHDWKPDLLIPQVFPSNWWGWLYRRSCKVPLIWICHEPSAFIHSRQWIDALKPWWKRLLALSLRPIFRRIDIGLGRYSDAIIANSRFTARSVEHTYHRAVAGIAYPGIDASQYFSDNTKRENALITVAALSRFKNVDFLLRVFARLVQQRPDMVYHIVGHGDEAGRLEQLAEKLGITENVIFYGRVSDEMLPALYRRSRLFLHGAVDEPFGLAPLEAIACGTPVVAHKSGGPSEFVDDTCGRLIPSLDETEWAEIIEGFLQLLEDQPAYLGPVPELSRRFSWNYSFQPVLDSILSLSGHGQSYEQSFKKDTETHNQ
ncbi:Glycosyltransferase involved in cell wall bisynthesis [Geobacter sp. DSM 9736]|nr:Glycosyltransferase involved in cell wall bisynthesis [Geobacter sp. DSM 9736]